MPCPNLEGGDQEAECQCWDYGIRKEKVQKLNVTIEHNESNEMISCSKLRLKLDFIIRRCDNHHYS